LPGGHGHPLNEFLIKHSFRNRLGQSFQTGITGFLTKIEFLMNPETDWVNYADPSFFYDRREFVDIYILDGDITRYTNPISTQLILNKIERIWIDDSGTVSVSLPKPFRVDSGKIYTVVIDKILNTAPVNVSNVYAQEYETGLKVYGGNQSLCGINNYDYGKSFYNVSYNLAHDDGNVRGTDDLFGFFMRTYVTPDCFSPLFTNNPLTKIAAVGDSLLITASHELTGASFAWQEYSNSWDDITDNNKYSGTDSNSLTISGLTKEDHLSKYRVKVQKGNCGPYYSDEVYVILTDTFINTVYDTTVVTVYDTNTVTVTDTNFVTVTDTLLIEITTGELPSVVSNTIKCYPNPTNGVLYFNNGNYESFTNYQIEITNSLGQQLFSSNINIDSFNVDISSWESGMYLINIFDGNLNRVDQRKILKQ
jgi:hypothetical protein